MNNINFELYKVFYYVAGKLSFSAAANSLYISQSAVSQSIKQLEEQLGSKLFFRNTKQVKLTKSGELLFSHVEQAFNFLKTGERSIAELQALQLGELKIGASDTICKYFLLPYLKQFHQLYPKIKINITNRPSPVCAELLRKGLVDISIINLPNARPDKDLTISRLQAVHDVFIAGPKYSHLQQQVLELRQLSGYPLLMLERNSTTRLFFDQYLQQHNLRITPEIELDSVDIMIELVKIGLGISFIAREYLQKELADNEVVLLNVNEPIPSRYLGVVTHASLPVPVAAQKFMELLVQ
ncbi:LysR family transcriptional regulator|uniref:DNA-binding transcriptional regulator, LysR family n=1 Tax=Dendrosporobacter quercicolus TaxID=146817 RepID=A0A1G9UTG7_9FIRM|nr:LysR family transcriptional regulator [Dendrosporobacter quercicolus]NSL48033.1 LysR family transcriptional regulator [Dendrosporobacter quercicolus DSM 1736]SDM63221.1 DNA-binding transcriptional regulator, LysR family [Dendrosporobacter quercicolus]